METITNTAEGRAHYSPLGKQYQSTYNKKYRYIWNNGCVLVIKYNLKIMNGSDPE